MEDELPLAEQVLKACPLALVLVALAGWVCNLFQLRLDLRLDIEDVLVHLAAGSIVTSVKLGAGNAAECVEVVGDGDLCRLEGILEAIEVLGASQMAVGSDVLAVLDAEGQLRLELGDLELECRWRHGEVIEQYSGWYMIV